MVVVSYGRTFFPPKCTKTAFLLMAEPNHREKTTMFWHKVQVKILVPDKVT